MVGQEIATEALGGPAAELLGALEECLLQRAGAVKATNQDALLAALSLLGEVLMTTARHSRWSRAQEEALREWAIESLRKLPFATGESADADR